MVADVIRYPSSAALVADVADRFLRLLSLLQSNERDPQVALTGGTIAHELYVEIAAQAPASDVDWTRIDFWWSDERFVALDSPERNDLDAREALLNAVGATRVHPMPTPNSACSVDEGARAYEAQVRASLGESPPGQFDLVLLSMGPDGHIASLFPRSPQINITNRIAVGVMGSPKPPPDRITLTLEALNRSNRVWLFAADSGPGGAKEEAFHRASAGDPDSPAAQVHGGEETTWFVS